MSHERFDRKVDGMICPQCEDEIAHRLLHTRGILSCTASYRKSTVTADFDPDILSADDIGRILAKTGYPVGDGRSGRHADAIALVLVACLYFAVPAITGLMPCGALSSMWIFAASSGSWASGAVSMLAFGAGTCVFMLLFGLLGTFLPKRYNKYLLKASTILIVALGLSLMTKGIRLLA